MIESQINCQNATAKLADSRSCCQFLNPHEYLTRYVDRTKTGRMYWKLKYVKEFCKLYLDADYKTFDKHKLHSFMYENRTELFFYPNGLPIWHYTVTPVKLQF